MNNIIMHSDLQSECWQHMTTNGLACIEPIILDGKIHRYSVDTNRSKRDEWYVAYECITTTRHRHFICIYGSWSDGSKYEFRSWDKFALDKETLRELNELAKNTRKASAQKLQEAHNKAAIKAKRIWEESATTPPSEEYLQYAKAKGIQLIGVRFGLNSNKHPSIVIPICNIKGEIRSLQRIAWDYEDGGSYKRFLSDGETKGNFYVLGNLSESTSVFITEGYATAATVYQATGLTTVIAFSAHGLSPVIEVVKNKFPDIEITIAGDDDKAGRENGLAAAKKFNCKVVFPEFSKDKNTDRPDKPYSDFNDLHQQYGLSEAQKQLANTIIVPTIQDELKSLAELWLKQEDPCIDFSLSSLPVPLRDYIESICATTNAHPMMVTMSVLTTISAFLGRRVSYPHYFQPLYPNLWMLAIAKSGQFKSTALNKGASLAWKRHAQVMAEIKEIESKMRTAVKDEEKTQLAEDRLAVSLTDVILPTKITGEALLEHLSQGHRGVILASEFGAFLQNLAKNHNNDLKPLFTDLYDVPPAYRYKTRTQGDLILEEPCFSICGVSTLTWVQGNIKTTDVASGFFARFLIFTPTHRNEIPPALPSLNALRDQRFEEEDRLMSILAQVDSSHIYNPLSGDAKIFFEAAHNKIYNMPHTYSERSQEILEPYLKRWSPYLLKLAMIMQIIEDPTSKDISTSAIIAAIGILYAAIRSTMCLFEGELGESDHQRKCRIVLEWICKKIRITGSKIKRQTLLASKQLAGGMKEYDDILMTLIEQGKISHEPKDKKGDSLYWPNDRNILEVN